MGAAGGTTSRAKSTSLWGASVARPLLRTSFMNTARVSRRGAWARAGVWAVATFVAPQFTHDAQACSLPANGWLPETLTRQGSGAGVVVGLRCFQDCAAPAEVEVTVRNDQAQIVEGSVTESQLKSNNGWAVWKPGQPLIEGASYTVSVVAGPDPYPWSSTHQVTGTAPSLPSEPSRAFEATGIVELLGGEPCCEQSAGAGAECEAPKCFPERSNARGMVRLSVSFPELVEVADAVVLSGEFFTADERRAAEPRLGSRLEATLTPATDGEYCYEITARMVLTDEAVTVTGCQSASEVELPDVEVERVRATLTAVAGCAIPHADYEALWCEAFAEEITAGKCSLSGIPSACGNALAMCPAPGDTANPEPASGCTVQTQPGASSCWTLGIPLAALAAISRGWRRARVLRPRRSD